MLVLRRLGLFLLFCACTGYVNADSPEQIQVGGSCSEEGLTYNLSSNVSRSAWELASLYAVPCGTPVPEMWEQASSFHTELQNHLESNDPVGFAQATVQIWQNFLSDQADVIATVHRTITETNDSLECVSGTWVSVNAQTVQLDDNSDWLLIAGSPYDVTKASSETTLEQNLHAKLDELNSQPGAQ